MKATPKWLEAEIEEKFFATLMAKLKAGGATLTQDECDVLLDFIKEQPKAKRGVGRPPDDGPGSKTWNLALASIMYQAAKGVPTKAAVEDVAAANGVSVSTVYAARQRLSEQFK